MRQLNRVSSMFLYEAPFYSYPTIISENLEILEKIQSQLSRTDTNLCEQLKQVNPTILTEINKFIKNYYCCSSLDNTTF